MILRRLQKVAVILISGIASASGIFKSFFGPWRQHFDALQGAGIHVIPVHYYSPIPDTRALDRSTWKRRSGMVEVEIGRHGGVEFLRGPITEFAKELGDVPAAKTRPGEYYFDNPAYMSGDATVLYSMIRQYSPKRIIEIGSGFSSLVVDMALEANGPGCDYVSIDPYPPEYLRHMRNQPRMISKPVQDVPLCDFEALEKDDILFIDSTHVARIGSDVVYEYLEILPRIRPGVIVHIHDIFLPMEYPEEWIVKHRFFWNEQYLLQAFLAFNDCFEIVWPGQLMHLDHGAEMEGIVPHYQAGLPPQLAPTSWWMRRI